MTPGEQGDADFDGQVDDDDYSIWKLQFGTSNGAGGAAAPGRPMRRQHRLTRHCCRCQTPWKRPRR